MSDVDVRVHKESFKVKDESCCRMKAINVGSSVFVNTSACLSTEDPDLLFLVWKLPPSMANLCKTVWSFTLTINAPVLNDMIKAIHLNACSSQAFRKRDLGIYSKYRQMQVGDQKLYVCLLLQHPITMDYSHDPFDATERQLSRHS